MAIMMDWHGNSWRIIPKGYGRIDIIPITSKENQMAPGKQSPRNDYPSHDHVTCGSAAVPKNASVFEHIDSRLAQTVERVYYNRDSIQRFADGMFGHENSDCVEETEGAQCLPWIQRMLDHINNINNAMGIIEYNMNRIDIE